MTVIIENKSRTIKRKCTYNSFQYKTKIPVLFRWRLLCSVRAQQTVEMRVRDHLGLDVYIARCKPPAWRSGSHNKHLQRSWGREVWHPWVFSRLWCSSLDKPSLAHITIKGKTITSSYNYPWENYHRPIQLVMEKLSQAYTTSYGKTITGLYNCPRENSQL